MSKIIDKFKTDYFAGIIEDKVAYLMIEIIENGLTIQSDKYSEIGQNIADAFHMTYSDISDIKTTIISEYYVIIEVITENE